MAHDRARRYEYGDGFTSRAGCTPENLPFFRLLHDPSRCEVVAVFVRPGTEDPVWEIGRCADYVPAELQKAWLREVIAPMPANLRALIPKEERDA